MQDEMPRVGCAACVDLTGGFCIHFFGSHTQKRELTFVLRVGFNEGQRSYRVAYATWSPPFACSIGLHPAGRYVVSCTQLYLIPLKQKRHCVRYQALEPQLQGS
jgi:hypothetical protein